MSAEYCVIKQVDTGQIVYTGDIIDCLVQAKSIDDALVIEDTQTGAVLAQRARKVDEWRALRKYLRKESDEHATTSLL